jgi:hypothetical protein
MRRRAERESDISGSGRGNKGVRVCLREGESCVRESNANEAKRRLGDDRQLARSASTWRRQQVEGKGNDKRSSGRDSRHQTAQDRQTTIVKGKGRDDGTVLFSSYVFFFSFPPRQLSVTTSSGGHNCKLRFDRVHVQTGEAL